MHAGGLWARGRRCHCPCVEKASGERKRGVRTVWKTGLSSHLLRKAGPASADSVVAVGRAVCERSPWLTGGGLFEDGGESVSVEEEAQDVVIGQVFVDLDHLESSHSWE